MNGAVRIFIAALGAVGWFASGSLSVAGIVPDPAGSVASAEFGVREPVAGAAGALAAVDDPVMQNDLVPANEGDAYQSSPVDGNSLVPVPRGDTKELVPVPHGRVRVQLWSDPPAGTVVPTGARARLYFRASNDCYVTLLSVDTEGRVRMLFPDRGDDGWVEGGHTYRIPARRAGYDLMFAGPPGQEYVYALASVYPMRDRYPEWLAERRVPDRGPWADDGWDDGWDNGWSDEDPDDTVYFTGWIIGDPFFRMRVFCRRLVPYPELPETYASAYVYFNVGRHVSYPRTVCADCHWGPHFDPYGPPCSAVSLRIGNVPCAGWVDFRVVFVPHYRYEVCRDWRPRGWRGSRWDGPDGRWVWSSADGRRLRGTFDSGRWVGRGEDGRSAWDRNGTKPLPPGRESEGRGPGREVRENAPQVNPWVRAHQERLESVVRPEKPEEGRRVEPRQEKPAETRPEQRHVEDRGRGERKPAQPDPPRVEPPKERKPEKPQPRNEGGRGRGRGR